MRNKNGKNQIVLSQAPSSANNHNEVASGEIFLEAPKFDPETGTFAKRKSIYEKLVTYRMPVP